MNTLFDLTGRKAIVTGAAQGLAYSMAEGLMESGAEVAVIDISDRTVEVAREFCGRGFRCHGIQADLSRIDELEGVFSRAVDALGGLDIIGLTDHLDFFRRRPPEENRDAESCVREAWEKRRPAGNGGIEVLAGIEIGQIHVDPAADDFVRTHPLDMVIGSMHAMPDDLDIYFHEYEKLDCDAFLHEYFDEVLKMEEHGGFDVLAHIDYPLRVMKYDGYTPSFDHFMDRVEQVLRSCIDRGYALELNAAGLGGWQKRVGPPQNVLYEYRRMGGERISIGSDAHTLAAVGRGFDDSVRNAQDAGFTHVTVFRERKPYFVPLG